MFSTVKGYLYGGLFLVIGLVFTAFLVSNASLRVKLKGIEDLVTQLETERTLLQSDLDAATRVVRQQELDKDQLRREIDYLSQLYANARVAEKEIEDRLRDQLQQTDIYVRESKDEDVIYWASEPVPVDLNRLLQQAANCANRDHSQDEVCLAADGTDWKM